MSLFQLGPVTVKPLPMPASVIFYERFKYSENKGSRANSVYKKPKKTYRDIDDPWCSFVPEPSNADAR